VGERWREFPANAHAGVFFFAKATRNQNFVFLADNNFGRRRFYKTISNGFTVPKERRWFKVEGFFLANF
jgi:hypothetical protein